MCRLRSGSAIPGESAQAIPQKVCRKPESLPLRGRWHFAAGKMTEGVSTSAAYPRCQPHRCRPAVLPLHRGGFFGLCKVRLPPVKGFAFHHPPRGGGLRRFVQTPKQFCHPGRIGAGNSTKSLQKTGKPPSQREVAFCRRQNDGRSFCDSRISLLPTPWPPPRHQSLPIVTLIVAAVRSNYVLAPTRPKASLSVCGSWCRLCGQIAHCRAERTATRLFDASSSNKQKPLHKSAEVLVCVGTYLSSRAASRPSRHSPKAKSVK